MAARQSLRAGFKRCVLSCARCCAQMFSLASMLRSIPLLAAVMLLVGTPAAQSASSRRQLQQREAAALSARPRVSCMLDPSESLEGAVEAAACMRSRPSLQPCTCMDRGCMDRGAWQNVIACTAPQHQNRLSLRGRSCSCKEPHMPGLM